ncbi:MAG TPA: GreA/GreB family elongation factor [Candidatus Saccharimonadales bacterium]|nr:GreA/GreB family elongation factor [Candidatus Saccharimonadales bacterium]
MHAIATHFWITPHGVNKLQGERTQLRRWMELIRLRLYQARGSRKRRDIDLILSEQHVVKDRLQRLETALDHTQELPPLWGHKTEAHAGDTVYLRHRDYIRSVLLVARETANPLDGMVSIISPIGRALLGRHPGEHVRLDTLDGKLSYEILKIV